MSNDVSFLSSRYKTQQFLVNEVMIIEDKRWFALVPDLHVLVYRIFSIMPFAETTICFSKDSTIQKLNKKFRNKNKPTNVLTFENSYSEAMGGDIILALQTIKKEATQNRRSVKNHLTHLIIHGLLHLQGYDHIYSDEAREMEMKEAFLLQKLRVPNPWKTHSLRNI